MQFFETTSPTCGPAVAGYTVESRLGGGGFAGVWRARAAGHGELLALKVARVASEAARRGFEREAAALAAVGAPWVPRLFGQGGLDDGRPYLAMELIEGSTLAAEIARLQGPMDPSRVVAVAGGVLAALEAIHGRGLIHGDLKPGNAMVGRAITLIDLGAADSGSDGPAAATAAYVAPEALVGGAVDARSDLYALGVMLYELLAGRRPFVGDRATVERGHLAMRPPPIGAPAPAALERLCMACLAKDPAARPASASAAREALRARSPSRSSGRAGERTQVMTAREPVVLLTVDGGDVEAATSAILERRGTLVSASGDRVVAAFLGRSGPDPAALALAVARGQVADGARAALHLASLKIRERPGRVAAVYGREVRDPDSWLPADRPAGLWVSPVAASVIGDRADEPDLIGRESLLATVEASLTDCERDGGPVLVTAIGEPGAGKTALAAAIERMARGRGARVERSIEAAASVAEAGDRLRALAADRPVAVIVDDIDHRDDAALDTIEYATLDGDARLWICVLGHRRLRRRRPGWGDRAHRHLGLALEALEEPAAMELAAALLAPAEYPPAATLRHLARWSGGNPAVLAALVATLKRAGIVRQRPSGSWYVATAELEALPASAAEQWIAIRELEALPPELAACARVCSVVGVELELDELDAVLRGADATGAASTEIDAGVGVTELAAREILVADGRRWRFRRPALREAIYGLLSAGDRRALHRLALAHWRRRRTDDDRSLAALARHAAGAGDSRAAAAAFIELGDRARAAHRSIEADRCYTDALAHREALGDRDRARALGGRGSVRYRMQRAGEAVADLEAARDCAGRAGDLGLLAELLLEEATALDWAEDFAASAARVEHAAALVAELGDPALEAQCWLGFGRAHWRRGAAARAAEYLSLAAAAAADRGETEHQIIALLLLGCALVVLDRLEEAELRFDEAIALCEASGDALHRCAAYANRAFLWSARRASKQLVDDLRAAVRIAREIGQPTLERGAVHNLAEHLHWSGAHREALGLARRGAELQRRFFDHPVPEDRLLVARVEAACGELDAALESARAVRESGAALGSTHRLALEMLEAFCAPGASGQRWDDLEERAAETLPPEERLEVLYFRMLACARAGEPGAAEPLGERARARLSETPIWSPAFERLLKR